MRDYENIGSVENLKYLKLLNLENTLLEDIEGLKEPILYKIKTLQHIILNKNKLKSIGSIKQELVSNITHISLQ